MIVAYIFKSVSVQIFTSQSCFFHALNYCSSELAASWGKTIFSSNALEREKQGKKFNFCIK